MLKISVQSAGWFQKDDPMGSFAFIKACGFEAVDFNIDHYLPVKKLVKSEEAPTSFFDQPTEDILAFFTPLKEAAEAQGIAFSQMHAPAPVWIEGRDELTDYILMAVEKCLDVCRFVGFPALVVHPDRNPDKELELAHNMEMYRKLIPAARRTGVKVCLENLPTHFNGRLTDGVCSTGEEVCRYIDTLNAEAGADCFGYCFDVGHANMMGCNLRDHLRKVGGRLTCLHVHDNNGTADWHTAPYTCVAPAGLQTDWEGFILGLRDIGYRNDLNFETFRVLRHLPKPLHDMMLRYIATVGRYFRDRITEEA